MSATPIKHAGSEGGENEENLAFATPTSNSSAAAALSTALSPSLEGLILFDLTTAPGASVAFSPHCMKTVVDLAILHVGYERRRLSFHQVRGELEDLVHPGVTVPTVEVGSGEYLTDSWAIAEWLAANHPQGQRLFPSTSSKRLAAFLSEVGKASLSPNLGPLCLPGVASRLDEDSKKYFIERKIGQERFNKMISITSDEKQGYIEGAHKVLGAVEVAMGYSTEPPTAAPAVPSPWLDAGPTPTHADAIMYGFIVFSRMAGKETWCKLWQPFPRLVRLAAAMEDFLGEEITRDYVKLV